MLGAMIGDLEERWAKANELLDKGTGTVSASCSHALASSSDPDEAASIRQTAAAMSTSAYRAVRAR